MLRGGGGAARSGMELGKAWIRQLVAKVIARSQAKKTFRSW
jgi:hypothetical protein